MSVLPEKGRNKRALWILFQLISYVGVGSTGRSAIAQIAKSWKMKLIDTKSATARMKINWIWSVFVSESRQTTAWISSAQITIAWITIAQITIAQLLDWLICAEAKSWTCTAVKKTCAAVKSWTSVAV